MRKVISYTTITAFLVLTSVISAPKASADTQYTVTINKYVDGVQATANNAENSSFPMASCWNAVNLGGPDCGIFSLDVGNSYQAMTSPMDAGSTYTTSEDTSGQTVGASCADGKPFELVGYTTSTESHADAATQSPTATVPDFTNLQSNSYVIVWNKDCTPKLTLDKVVDNNNTGIGQESDWT